MGTGNILSTLIISAKDVRELLHMGEVVDAVEDAFRAYGEGELEMPPKAYLKVREGDFRAMPSCMAGAAAIKWVNCHPNNRSKGLPTVMGVLIYSDSETGYPLAVMDATEITAYRTGATAAIASKYLARRDSRTLGLVGAGRQAYSQLLAHAEIFNLELIKVYDIRPEASRRFVESFPHLRIIASSCEETASSDIVCTLTPAREPLIKREWIRDGTHINAIGADAEGKEELDPSILKDATVVVDDLRQATAAGEINVPLRKGMFRLEQVYATLAQVVTGEKQGRKADNEVTVFDSTGIAIEDLAIAKLVYEKAQQEGRGLAIELVQAG
jgi:alanine dehydrogenase